MKTVALLIVLSTSVFTAEAKDWFYASLNKLYQSNPKKCLERSKKVMKFFPQTPSPYFFAGKISLDKAEKAKSSLAKYRLLLSAVSYTEKFNKLTDSLSKTHYPWAETVQELELSLNEVSALLERDGNGKQRSNLLHKWPDFLQASAEQAEALSETPATPSELSNNSSENATFSFNENMQLMGMPKGTENLPSHNPGHERELLKLINLERRKKGLDTLTWNEDLARASRYHATDLASQNYFDHDSYDLVKGKLQRTGGTFERIRKFYTGSFVNSENIAAGSGLPASTYEQWYNSPGHYKNMFNPGSKKVGIGVVYVPNSDYGYYWVFCTAE